MTPQTGATPDMADLLTTIFTYLPKGSGVQWSLIATPTALLVGTGRGSQLGILIRGPQVLEQTRKIDTIVLDKTGTVTSGAMTVSGVHSVDGTTEAELLRLAAAVEHGSEHPIARAIVAAVDSPQPAEAFTAHAGLGVQAIVDGSLVVAGRLAWLREHWSPHGQ